MRARGTMILAAVLLTLAACSSDSTSSADTSSAGTPAPTDSSTSTSVPSSTTAASTTTVALATTIVTPVATTLPAATAPPATAAPVTVAPGPQFVSFDVTAPAGCSAPGVSFEPPPNEVTVSWEFKAVDSVYTAIDNPDGPFETDLPPKGSAVLPFACPGPHTFYVVAEGAGVKVVKSKTFIGS